MKHFVILFAVATLLFLSFFATTCVADLYPPDNLWVRPTVEQFKAEIVRADLVIRARVTYILFHRGGNHADEDVRVEVLKVYKGKPSSTCPCVRIEIYWHWAWDEAGTPRLPRVSDEVILPIEAIVTWAIERAQRQKNTVRPSRVNASPVGPTGSSKNVRSATTPRSL